MKKLLCLTLLGFVFSLTPLISNAAATATPLEAPLGVETTKPVKKAKHEAKHEKKAEKKAKKKAGKKHVQGKQENPA